MGEPGICCSAIGRRTSPLLAALQVALDEHDEGRNDVKTTSPLERLFSGLVAYRNRELGHGVDWRRSAEEYARLGNLLLEAAAEVFARLDVLAGRRLVYLTNLRASADVIPALDRFELTGEVPIRLEPVTLDPEATGYPPRPDRLYLMIPEDALQVAGASQRSGAAAVRPPGPLRPRDGRGVLLQPGARGPAAGIYLLHDRALHQPPRPGRRVPFPAGPGLDIQPQQEAAVDHPESPRRASGEDTAEAAPSA